MTTTPTLPGTLPGLLQPGAPVIFTVEHITASGWLVSRPAWWTSVGIDGDYCAMVDDSSNEVRTVHISSLALDLSRPEGVDRALRWLGERLGLPAGPLPPWLDRYVEADGATWYLMETTAHERSLGHGDITDPIEALRLACLAAGGAE